MYRIEKTEYNAADSTNIAATLAYCAVLFEASTTPEVTPVVEQACRYEHGHDDIEPERRRNVGHAKAYSSIW